MLEWKSLFSEDMKTLSLGRLAFWIALSYSTWFWFHPLGAVYPPALLEFLYATLAYNLGAKGVSAYQNVRTPGCGTLLPNLTPQNIKPQINSIKTLPQDDISEDEVINTKKR